MDGVLWLAEGGALRCRTPHSLHVLPPTLALWVPEAVPHDVQRLGAARVRRIELSLADEAIDEHMRGACRVALAGPLLTALARTLDDGAGVQTATRREYLALALTREEMQGAKPLPIGVALPSSPALRRVCEAALEDSVADWNLESLARTADTSGRTLARRFRQELALPFSHWRAQVRLARLITLWAEGHTLSASAAAVGYTSPSALSFMVRRMLGITPTRLLSG